MAPLQVFQRRDGMTPEHAAAEVERRVAVIEAVVADRPPRRLAYEIDDLEQQLEACRRELSALLIRAEAIASQLRARYQERVTKGDD